jgi:hypothetical protein
MNFVVFTPLGEIVKSGICQPSTLALQAVEEGEVAMEGYGGDMTHYVDLTGPEPVIREVP